MDTITIHPKILYFGTPVCLISSRNPDGTTNLTPMSSAWALDRRVVLGLGRDGQALRNLQRERDCVINLPSPELWPAVERLAPTTGRADVPSHKRALGYRHEPDKFAEARLTPVASVAVKPARIAECPLQLEARVCAIHPASGDNPAFVIVETEVLVVHALPHIVVPGTGHIDAERWAPLLYVFRRYFGTGPCLGKNFRAETS
jgi:flavin reductase (DIM6/NTAB) family NADH-FMN oxidoreductase RutF